MTKLVVFIAILNVFLITGCSKPTSVFSSDTLVALEEKKTCKLRDDLAQMALTFESLQEQKWDINKVGCGAVYAYEAANNSTFNIELKLKAVGAQINYFVMLDKLYPNLYQEGELGRKLNQRWDAARARAENLIAQVDKFDFIAPEVAALNSIYLLTSTTKNTSTKKQLKTLPMAKALMAEALERDKHVLDGLGFQVMAKLYIDLPIFAGGNLKQGLAMYEELLALQPENLELLSYMLEGYLAKGDTKRQIELIQQTTKIKTENVNPQDVADLYQALGGAANRLEQQDAILYFRTARSSLLKNNPHLLARKSTATLGHGGTDPITGQDPNKI